MMSDVLHLLISLVMSYNITKTLPAFLTRRFNGKGATYISFILIFLVSLFPIAPHLAYFFLFFCIAFTLIVLLFYTGSLLRRIAFSTIFFSIIGAWSYLTCYCIYISERFDPPLWLNYSIMLLLFILTNLYFTVVHEYMKAADTSSLDSFTDRLWGYTAFISLCPPLVTFLVASDPPSIPIVMFLTVFFVVTASTAMIPLIYQIGRSTKLAKENARLKERTGYYKDLENEQMQIRKIKHDLMNHFTVVATYLDLGENEKAIEYFKKLGADFANLTKTYTKNPLINAVLNSKFQKATIANIELMIDVSADTSKLEESTDLCTLIANSLDNAIEAMPPDGKINLTLKEDSSSFIYTCSNAYKGEVKKRTDGTFETSKNDKEYHGLGISNIKEAVERMQGTMKISSSNGVFTVTATIPKKK